MTKQHEILCTLKDNLLDLVQIEICITSVLTNSTRTSRLLCEQNILELSANRIKENTLDGVLKSLIYTEQKYKRPM